MIWWPTEIPTLSYGLTTLRPMEKSDIPFIHQGLQDPLIPKFTTIQAGYTLENAQYFVNVKSPEFFAEKREFPLAITHDGEFAGVISLHSIKIADHCAEVGYWISAHMRDKGICGSAVHLITEYGFTTIGFRRIQAIVDLTNAPSRALLLSHGYEFECLMRSASTTPDGVQVDSALYSAISN